MRPVPWTRMTCSRRSSRFGQISGCEKAVLYEFLKGVVELSPGSCQGTVLFDTVGQLGIEHDEAGSQDSPVGLGK